MLKLRGTGTSEIPAIDLTTPLAVVDGGTGSSTINPYQMVLGASVPYTSFTTTTYHDFTGIPSWVKRITVTLKGISTSSTSALRLQIGGGSVEVTGYDSTGTTMGVGNATTTAGFDNYNAAAADVRTQYCVLVSMGSNLWMYVAQSTPAGSGNPGFVTGNKTTSTTLDRVRITTSNGTDTFDAGSVNILYEGYA